MIDAPPPARLKRNSFAAQMRAMGEADLPATFSAGDEVYHHQRTIKHDFFAATGIYATNHGKRAILKMNRPTEFMGLPLQWLGRFLCDREVRCYQALADVPNIPAYLGKVGQTGMAHAYIEGRPLAKSMPVPDGFFDQLRELFDLMNRRGIAYVDTNKPENILLGEDGRPYLIDFQINFALHDFGDNALSRAILQRFHAADLYHLCKHKKRLRPDLLRPDEANLAKRRGWLIRTHRLLTRPYFLLRRRTIKRLEKSGHIAASGSN